MGAAATQADLAWLGLGLNGHVGFHEPGIDPRMFSGCVRLSAKSTETLQLEPDTWGLTYGVGAFMACKAILILVRGESKREVLTRLLRADPALPASHLLRHGNLTSLSDFSF
jgi:glucosamine-6-phosphate deaminase